MSNQSIFIHFYLVAKHILFIFAAVLKQLLFTLRIFNVAIPIIFCKDNKYFRYGKEKTNNFKARICRKTRKRLWSKQSDRIKGTWLELR